MLKKIKNDTMCIVSFKNNIYKKIKLQNLLQSL